MWSVRSKYNLGWCGMVSDRRQPLNRHRYDSLRPLRVYLNVVRIWTFCLKDRALMFHLMCNLKESSLTCKILVAVSATITFNTVRTRITSGLTSMIVFITPPHTFTYKWSRFCMMLEDLRVCLVRDIMSNGRDDFSDTLLESRCCVCLPFSGNDRHLEWLMCD